MQKYLDQVARQLVADQTAVARKHPGTLLAAEVVNKAVAVAVLTRMGRRLGLPLKARHWWFLVAVFGREPGYPFNLIWQQTPVVTVEDIVKALRGRPTPRRVVEPDPVVMEGVEKILSGEIKPDDASPEAMRAAVEKAVAHLQTNSRYRPPGAQ